MEDMLINPNTEKQRLIVKAKLGGIMSAALRRSTFGQQAKITYD